MNTQILTVQSLKASVIPASSKASLPSKSHALPAGPSQADGTDQDTLRRSGYVYILFVIGRDFENRTHDKTSGRPSI